MIWKSDIGPGQLKKWNNEIKFSPRDLDDFGGRKVKTGSVTSKALEYIANASNLSLILNADYLLSAMDVDANVKWVGDTEKRVNKLKKTYILNCFSVSSFAFSCRNLV